VVVAVSVSVVALLAPAGQAASSPAPDPFFGTWSDGYSNPASDPASQTAVQGEMDRQAATGVGLRRQYVWWNRIEQNQTTPATYNWSWTDRLMRDASARGIHILPTLLYPPDFYSSKPEGSTSTAQFPPRDPQKMADFAAAMVKRYGTHGTYWNCKEVPLVGWQCDKPYLPITMWEVWNEPDYPGWWKGVPDPDEYLALLEVVAPAIKQADPSAQVVLGSMTNAGGGSKGGFLEQLYQRGAENYFDVLSINPYARDVGAMLAYVRGQRAIAAQYGDAAKPILVTEYGWATGGNSAYFVTDEACQAALLYRATREFSQRRGELGLLALAQFQWRDVAPGGTAWPNYAGVIRADGTDKPSREALRAAIAGEPAPAGAELGACPADQRSLDGTLQTLTVTTSGSGTGSVKSNPPGVTCGTDCDGQFQPRAAVKLAATPDPGSRFVGWTVDGISDCLTVDCTVTMADANEDVGRDVRAVFDRVATAGIHQESDPLVSYTGPWTLATGTQDLGHRSKAATTGPASASMWFQGTGVSWISRKSPMSGINRVYLDGVLVAKVDRYSSTVERRVEVYSSAELASGDHSIRIEFTGRKNPLARDNDVLLDAFVVR